MRCDEGFVNVGMTHDTAEFAVESLGRGWKLFGQQHYPEAQCLLVCADGGGSTGVGTAPGNITCNGSLTRGGWK